ncbi:MAG: YbaB/EbfC family nucleoid-associated protein [candidate division Zixibacteria bacterium]|nr:YbaB/EbfC family nucleoid-associated protein [candidate division Zixibacteria bacterium]
MLGNLGQLAQLLRQAKDVQQKLGEVQKKLAAMTVEASAGGGMVTVVANGHQEILSVKIDPAAVSADEVELLEELVLAAVNAARKKAEAMARDEMSGLARGLNLPEGLNLPDLSR